MMRKSLTKIILFVALLVMFSAFVYAGPPINLTCPTYDGNPTACDADGNCSWESSENMCVPNCAQYDGAGNETLCIDAFGGDMCKWFADEDICDPPGFNECGDCHFNCDDNGTCHDVCEQQIYCQGGDMEFSNCFFYDGNETGCNNESGCNWFANEQECNPTMNFGGGGSSDCYTYDGDRDQCLQQASMFAKPCEWSPDPWGPLINGTEKGWCNGMMGGSGSGGCWDYKENQTCTDAASIGMPCTWISQDADAWCEEKGCWDYQDNNTCIASGCDWDTSGNYCYEVSCWDAQSAVQCNALNSTDKMSCTWMTDQNGNTWCEEQGCWVNDWTDQSTCEAQDGCEWEAGNNACKGKGCWDFGNNQTTCESAIGIECQWKEGSAGWCEQEGCNAYDTNESYCVNGSSASGLSCEWKGNGCFEAVKECTEYVGDMKGCFDTGYCIWEPNTNNCTTPDVSGMVFQNPSCFIFDKAGTTKCSNVSTCAWDGANCLDNTTGANGIQCADIVDADFCGSIPMLSTCCQWNGTTCGDAPFTKSCWDSMQEPPEGAFFCDDYNAKNSEPLCNQIAGDPYYMPCEWNNQTSECKFAFDDMFGGQGPVGGGDFGFKDVGSKANCEAVGGIWKSEKWTDPSGGINIDEWCEMGFGGNFESCDTACWACEYQDNQSAWATSDLAQAACEGSGLGKCIFRQDSNSFNNYGWCDQDWSKSGNCDENCWECWDGDTCSESITGCKWFTDPWNNNTGWCDDKNVKTCDDDCYQCWDQTNCVDSDASCSWDMNNWYCKPSNSGDGSSSEVCFDGIDNDADTFVDCSDPECAFNDFCGGAGVFGSNCPSIPNNTTCIAENCTWITDPWNNSWCDMPGAQCWLYDKNQTECDLAGNGCTYKSMDDFGKNDTFCDVNKTKMESVACWDYQNTTSCNSAGNGCEWMEDPWCSSPEGQQDPWCQNNNATGWCDYQMWSCPNLGNNQTACEANANCGWQTDWFDPTMGWCDPICFTRNASTCATAVNGTAGICESMNASEVGWCEPENMFRGCMDYDENDCATNNETCTWIDDPRGGFCGDKFMNQMVGDMDQSPPLMLEFEDCVSGPNEAQDICGIGIKDDENTWGIGTGVNNMGQTAVCNDMFGLGGNRSAKFYWYLDINGNQSGGCAPDDNSSLVGFDFKFKYESIIQDSEFVETKVAYKCMGGNWSPSMIKLSTWPDKMCYMVNGGVVAITKEDVSKLEVLGLYDSSADMRIYATTANATSSESTPADTIGPVWYSQGSADFKFENCQGFVDDDGDGLLPSDDPDCADFLRNGYIVNENGIDCADGIDNDGNGDIDCLDPGCMYDAYFCSQDNISDNSAPKITWMEVYSFTDGAFVGVDTDEPTNATVDFFRNDSFCQNISQGIFVPDWKLGNDWDGDDYDLWHDLPLDQKYFDENSYNQTFVMNTTYFFKTKLCDKSGNCALSACLNFTTKTNSSAFTIGFELPPPLDDVTDPLGNVNVKFDWDGSGSFGDTIDGDTGHRINESQGKDVNLKFENPNSTMNWSIDFVGADFMGAQNLNISGAFIVNETDDSNKSLVGMDSDIWDQMAQKLGVDYVTITIPEGGFDSDDAVIKHCPDNATSLNDSKCIAINATDMECVFNTTETVCDVPTSIGFTVFGVTGPEAAAPVVVVNTPGGGGGGGGAASPVTAITVTKEGKSSYLTRRTRVELIVDSIAEKHYVNLTKIDVANKLVTLVVTSDPQIFVLGINKTVKADLDGNDMYDIAITLSNIYEISGRAKVDIKKINEPVPASAIAPAPVVVADEKDDVLIPELPVTGMVPVDAEGEERSRFAKAGPILSVIFILILVLALVLLMMKAHKSHEHKLHGYIKRQLKRGVSKDNIHKTLTDSGWKKEHVDTSFDKLKK
jgi:hypothetical protein